MIAIKDREMPKNCAGCFLRVGQCSKRIYMENRPSDCPLIEVPEPHGRLGDLDKLLMRINHEVMEAYMGGVCYGVHPNQEYLYLLGEIIDDAHTIIPATEEG